MSFMTLFQGCRDNFFIVSSVSLVTLEHLLGDHTLPGLGHHTAVKQFTSGLLVRLFLRFKSSSHDIKKRFVLLRNMSVCNCHRYEHLPNIFDKCVELVVICLCYPSIKSKVVFSRTPAKL